jgi:putative heme degradation protein
VLDPFLPGDHVGSIAARCGSDTLRLEAEWPTILQCIPRLGRVVAHTCNRDAEVSQPGHFAPPAICSERRAFLGGDFVLACRLALANAGATHAYAGSVDRFEGVARWKLAFASRATLTIDAASIARAWLVRTLHGPAPRNSIELFDRGGKTIVRFGYAGI